MAVPHLTNQPPKATGPVDLRRLLAAHRIAGDFYRSMLSRADGPAHYLRQRGLGVLVEREWPWRIGYAPGGWNNLTRHLRAAGFDRDELLAAGLATRTHDDRLIDTFRNRIVFPVRDPGGNTVAFIGRAADSAGDVPKYLNSPETAIYTKGLLLFGIGEQQDRLRAGWSPVLVEGPTDVVAVWLSYSARGTTGAVAVAPCGTAMTDTQAAILAQIPGAARGIVLATDGDSAGSRAADKAWELLRNAPGPLLAAEFTTGTDPADLLRQPTGRPALRAVLQRRTRPLIDALIDHRLDRMTSRHPRLLDDIGGRCAAVRALLPLLVQVPAGQHSRRLVEHIANRVGVGVDTVVIAAADHIEHLVTSHGEDIAAPTGHTSSRPPPTAAGFPTLRVAGSPTSRSTSGQHGDPMLRPPRRAR